MLYSKLHTQQFTEPCSMFNTYQYMIFTQIEKEKKTHATKV